MQTSKENIWQEIINHYYAEGKLRDILLVHSRGVAQMALEVCDAHPELHLDRQFVENAAMLHDIGIINCDAAGIECYGNEPYITHGRLGAEMLRRDAAIFHLSAEEVERYARVCERHTGTGLTCKAIIERNLPLPHQDFVPETLEEQLVCYADKFFSKTHPERKKTIENALRSLEKFGSEGVEQMKRWHAFFG